VRRERDRAVRQQLVADELLLARVRSEPERAAVLACDRREALELVDRFLELWQVGQVLAVETSREGVRARARTGGDLLGGQQRRADAEEPGCTSRRSAWSRCHGNSDRSASAANA
jgi:hypothetical protein